MNHATLSADLSLADLVQRNERAARVLDDFGLPFCCDGQRSLRDAVARRGLSLETVLDALAHVEATGEPTPGPTHWGDLRDLVRELKDRHHAYVRTTAPAIAGWLERLAEHHGERHPELALIQRGFADLMTDLLTHMLKEEHLVFPYIVELEAARLDGRRMPSGPFGTVLNPIRVMESDHVRLGGLMTRIHELANGFAAPADGCATYRLCCEALADFECNLHRHVHLENNVLFPRAIEIERGLI